MCPTPRWQQGVCNGSQARSPPGALCLLSFGLLGPLTHVRCVQHGAGGALRTCSGRGWRSSCARGLCCSRPRGSPAPPPAAGKRRGARAAAGGGREQPRPRAAPRGRLLPVPLLGPAGGGSYFWRPAWRAWRAAGGHGFSGPVWFPPTKPVPVACLLTCSWVLPLAGAVQGFSWTAGHHDFVLGHVLEATQAGGHVGGRDRQVPHTPPSPASPSPRFWAGPGKVPSTAWACGAWSWCCL